MLTNELNLCPLSVAGLIYCYQVAIYRKVDRHAVPSRLNGAINSRCLSNRLRL